MKNVRYMVLLLCVILGWVWGLMWYTVNREVDCSKVSELPEVKVAQSVQVKVGEPVNIEVKNKNG